MRGPRDSLPSEGGQESEGEGKMWKWTGKVMTELDFQEKERIFRQAMPSLQGRTNPQLGNPYPMCVCWACRLWAIRRTKNYIPFAWLFDLLEPPLSHPSFLASTSRFRNRSAPGDGWAHSNPPDARTDCSRLPAASFRISSQVAPIRGVSQLPGVRQRVPAVRAGSVRPMRADGCLHSDCAGNASRSEEEPMEL